MGNRKSTAARIILTVLTVTAVAAIFYNSSLSAVESTEQSSPLTELINSFLSSLHIPLTLEETVIRKAAHFTEYAVLGTLLTVTVHLYVKKRSRTLLLALPLGAVVAVCDELIQLFPAGRSCEVRDMLIDFCGILFAALIVTLIISNIEKRRNKKGMKEG
ncbi:MAG: VanZ family protein [Ruminococcus sp.]|nr:VanZ family protein [Ruminococcus sp.]